MEVLEDLFELDRNNYRVAMLISENNMEMDEFEDAYEWAQKAIKISKSNAESLSHMGNLYYRAMQACRGENFSRSDKIIASIAYNYFLKADKETYPAINLYEYIDIQIWGVAIYSIHELQKLKM